MNDEPRAVTLERLQRLRAALLSMSEEMAEDEKLFFDTLDAASDDLDRMRAVLRRAIILEATADALQDLQRTMAARKARLLGSADSCRDWVRECMEALKLTKLDAPDFSARRGLSVGGLAVTDIDAIPEQYVRKEAKLLEIGKALANGETVPGIERRNGTPTLIVRRN